MRFIWLLFILFALLALACGGTTELPTSAPIPTPSPTRQASLETFHDLIWIDLQPFADASGNRLFDLQTTDWYRWQKELGGYAPPDGELSDFTLVLTDDRYGLLPAPTPQFQITRTIETENTRIGWGMSMGSNYVLLQRTIQERDEQNNLSTAHQLFYTRNEQDAPTIPLPDVVPLTTQSHQLLRHVTWSPDYQRLVLQQPQNNTLYLLDIPTAQWRTLDLSETQYDIIWSPDSQSLALRMSEVVTLYNWQTDEQTQIEGSAGSIFWSADSSQLLFSRPPGLFLQVDVATKEHVTLAETAVTPIFPTRWHNEGQATLLHGRNDDVLYELDLATQSVRPLFIPSEPQEDEDKRSLVRPYDQTAVSPDNQMVAFSWRNQLWLASLTEPTEPILLYEDERITTLLWSPDSQQLLFMTQQDCLPNTSCLNTLHLASTIDNTIEQVLDFAMSSTYTPELLFWLP